MHIDPLSSDGDALAFRILNEEWIVRHFTLEPKDHLILNDPRGNILAKGGQIFMVRVDEEPDPVGTVALIPMQNGVFELSKMAISPKLRGLGIGRKLIRFAIAEAKNLGATSLFLGSSTKLPNAVHLYESVGFTHVPEDRWPSSTYARADVFMEMPLQA